MTPPGFSPLSAGEIVDRSFGMMRAHFTRLLLPAVPVYLAGYAIDLGLVLAAAPGWRLGRMVLGTAAAGLAHGLAIAVAFDLLHGRPAGSHTAWPRVLPRIGAVVVGHAVKWITVTFGLLLLVIPGAYLLCLYFAVPTVSVTEGLGVRAARARSRALARPHLTRILGSVGLVELGVLLLTGLVQLTLVLWLRSTSPTLLTTLAWGLGLLLLPLKGAVLTVAYVDSRVRSEGYDLEQTLGAIPPYEVP